MNGLAQTLTILGGLTALLLIAGAVVVVLRQGSVRELRSVNTDLRGERDDWKGRYEDELAARTQLAHRVENLEGENRRKDLALARIGEQALGTADIRQLADNLGELVRLEGHHDEQAATRHRQTVDALGAITRAMVGFRDALEHRDDPKPPEVPGA